MKKITNSLLQKMRLIPGLDWVALALGLGTFALLVLHSITASSIWFDEAFSAYLVRFNYVDIARYTAMDVHPPFYYWLLKLWTDLFGTSALAFRSLSLLFGMTAIAAAFILVRRLFGRRAAWVSLLLLVVSPMLVRYSQEARMYTLAATIALGATYVLSRAVESNRRRTWLLYGLLVSLGMWTHYFTALVWLAHWVWRAVVTYQSGARGKDFRLSFFSKRWIMAYALSVGLFLPWLPLMLLQLTAIQGTGFWIGPMSADTLTSYLTNVLFYLDHDKAEGWYGLMLAVILSVLAILAYKLYRALGARQRQSYLLIMALAFVPVLLLFILSLPPLKSSFVERYLIPSVIGFSLFAGVTLALGAAKLKAVWRVAAIALVVVSMLIGILNVYYYGNYNKNSKLKVNSGELVQEISRRSQSGQPIIVESPWVFYEAVFYDSAEHPVYFINARTDYNFGSLEMLEHNDQHKIKDLTAFARQHPVVWFIGNNGDQPVLSPPVSGWKPLQKFSIYDKITDTDPYKAVQFQTN